MQWGVTYRGVKKGEGKGGVIVLFGGWEKEHHFDVFAILGFFSEQIGCYRCYGTTY